MLSWSFLSHPLVSVVKFDTHKKPQQAELANPDSLRSAGLGAEVGFWMQWWGTLVPQHSLFRVHKKNAILEN
jgi:hypothetical protein